MTEHIELKGSLAAATLATLFLVAGCGDGSNTGADALAKRNQNADAVKPPAQSSATTAAVSGKITYDFVPAVASKDQQGRWQAKLDYAKTVQKPARNVVVELIDDKTGKVLLSAETDAQGGYAFQAPLNTAVRVRAKAQMLRTGSAGPSWNFAVRDHSSAGYGVSTNGAALFAMESASFNSGKQASIHDLNAASGWDATKSTYATSRSAGPFAILDTVYNASHKVLEADKNLAFPPLNVFWSPGDTDGTYFGSESGKSNSRGLHILGQADVDTDEYDAGVIAHEWGHYFQASFSRDDSTGGSHGQGDLLDMRLAFSEGWGNSFSSMARNDPMYVDTNGKSQGKRAVVFKVDDIPADDPKAWFSETAVQSVLYRLHQSPDIGFGPIYQAMAAQKTSPAFTSLFSFAAALRGKINAAGQATLDSLLTEVNTINKDNLDMFGSKQASLPASIIAANKDFVLPVYTLLDVGLQTTAQTAGKESTACNTTAYDAGNNYNKLGVYRYLRFGIAEKGKYRLRIVPDQGLAPYLQLYSKGTALAGDTVKNQLIEDPNHPGTYYANYDLPVQNDYVATLTTVGDAPGCFKLLLTQVK
ncbi:hypothetical protein [Collimonas fungivorans]|uniref:Uncharacterized protein n=1 Tax=Collimonas fungivorans (strain Ter331) TaxID=1005048 RepID=G0AHC4_COLFT|nr:hypothetical protein [Collimonas fungivorans]AEK62530.1 hypothetical protein CFU_2703 [Collimonas fungivorans Ter331]